MPRLALAKTLWGVPEADDPSKWDALFGRIKAEGFEAVEAITLAWRKDTKLFRELLDKHGLQLICQIHTTGGDVDPKTGEYFYCTSNKLHEHLASFMKLTSEAAQLKPVLINSHSGHDSWGSGDKAVAFLKHALKIEAALGIPIVHETHRQRLLYSPYSTAELLAVPELAKLKINADLSHWCCVCEHVFDATSPRDDFWPATLAAVARHCALIHCRVGHAEGPQVNDPDAPEHAADVNAHFSWWHTIWLAQLERAQADGEADAVLWAEPEFGPPPYLQTLPYTGAPVADLWDINKRVAARIRTEFASALQEASAPPPAPVEPTGTVKRDTVWVPQLGGGYVLKNADGSRITPADAESTGSAPSAPPAVPVGGMGGGLLDLAIKDAAKEERERLAAAEKQAVFTKAVTEVCVTIGASESDCAVARIDMAEGDVTLLNTAMTAINQQVAGTKSKIIFSPGEDQLAIVGYVPASKVGTLSVGDWTASVLKAIGGTVMASRPADADSPHGGKIVQAAVAVDPSQQEGITPEIALEIGMKAAIAFVGGE